MNTTAHSNNNKNNNKNDDYDNNNNSQLDFTHYWPDKWHHANQLLAVCDRWSGQRHLTVTDNCSRSLITRYLATLLARQHFWRKLTKSRGPGNWSTRSAFHRSDQTAISRSLPDRGEQQSVWPPSAPFLVPAEAQRTTTSQRASDPTNCR